MRLLHSLALLGAFLLLLPGTAAAADRLVLLIDNRSASPTAVAELTPILTAALTRKGYEVVQGPEVDALVRTMGLPHAELLGAVAAGKLIDQLKAKGVVTVTIRFFLEPQARARGPRASPAVGLSAQAFTAGRAWRNSRSIIEEEPASKRPMAATVVAKLLWPFPAAPGALLASAAEDWDEMTGAPPPAGTGPAAVPDYNVLIERLRAGRTGPRFALRMSKKNR